MSFFSLFFLKYFKQTGQQTLKQTRERTVKLILKDGKGKLYSKKARKKRIRKEPKACMHFIYYIMPGTS